MPNRQELIQIALRNQRHRALETPVPVVDIKDLPDDLLTVLVDCGNSEHYKLHGFVRSDCKLIRYIHAGNRVDACPMHILGGDAMVAIRPEIGKPITFFEAESCKRVPRASLTTFEQSEEWWYASIKGNGIVLEQELRDRNFPASCGSLNFVAVRSAHTVNETVDDLPLPKPQKPPTQ